MKIELFQVPGCDRCDFEKAELQSVVMSHSIEWRTVPMLLWAWAIGWLEPQHQLNPIRLVFDLAGGIALIATGLYLINPYLVLIPALVR
ncbi:MAG: hypothetical protein KGM83_00430 [Betaproteobacteria bacterium]|nr:hypothetical protein [Betaproteobacteria bacterium]